MVDMQEIVCYTTFSVMFNVDNPFNTPFIRKVIL